ncbi:hypothetical protein [uncultured Kriegella sp.]|uniref:tetratricopeptide repeat protein n=1 Tax=uncultured Kriegella sp. TaxID=1798910 RepID=UPI0030D93462
MNKLRYLSPLLILFIVCCKNRQNPEKKIIVQATAESKYGCAPQVTDATWYTKNNKAPLFDGLNAVHYPITTQNSEVQKYFDQGLLLAYGFNHAEAARSFYYATKLDPDCAMCYWGYAYVLGPNYNAGMEDDNYQRAYKAIKMANELKDNATAKEKALITAMTYRYAEKPVENRDELDLAYSDAMKKVSAAYPDDTEINTIYAESIMNLHPWDLYDKNGLPRPWALEIENLLEKILAINPKHPGANHFYIHAVEMSDTPERAYQSAKVFDDGLASGAGHLVHMASHVYIRTGDYHKGTLANINAIAADSTYVTKCHAQGAYPLAYYPHNYHFLAATATLEGNSKWAMIGAHKVSEHVHPDIMKEIGWGTLQHYYVIPYYVAVKLGQWDAILDMKLNSYNLPYIQAIQHYTEGIAHLRKNNLLKSKESLSKLDKLKSNETLKEVTIWDINSTSDLVNIAQKVLLGEIMAEEGKFAAGIAVLQEAVALEDRLNYNEPPDWFFSVRHHLGAVQIEAGLYTDAIQTYHKDLERLPKNGWAQHGLKLAYEKLNDHEKAAQMKLLLKKSWATADIEISGSRIK